MGVLKIKARFIVVAVLIVILSLLSVNAELELADQDDLSVVFNYRGLNDNDRSLDLERSIGFKNDVTESFTFSVESLEDDYELTLNSQTLEIGTETVNLEFELTVPVNVDQGQTDRVARIKAVGPDNEERFFDLKTEVETMLDLERIYVFAGGNQVKRITEDDEKVENLEPGSQIELKFEIENLFDEDYDFGDLEVEISLNLDDNDFTEDVDEEESYDIKAGTKLEGDDAVLTFEIPQKAEEGNYDLEIVIKAEDENRAKYRIERDLFLEVERKNDDIRLDNINFLPEKTSCSTENVELVTKVVNFGQHRQKNAALTFISANLKLDERFDFELESGTSDDNFVVKKLNIKVPDGLQPGSYPIAVNAYYDFSTHADREVVNLVLEECVQQEQQQVVEDKLSETPMEDQEKEEVSDLETVSPASKVVKTIEDPYTTEDFVFGALIVAIVVILALIVIFIIVLFR